MPICLFSRGHKDTEGVECSAVDMSSCCQDDDDDNDVTLEKLGCVMQHHLSELA